MLKPIQPGGKKKLIAATLRGDTIEKESPVETEGKDNVEETQETSAQKETKIVVGDTKENPVGPDTAAVGLCGRFAGCREQTGYAWIASQGNSQASRYRCSTSA